MEDRTTFVVGHHLATIRHANVIFVIKDSVLAEQGTHDELLKAGGEYAALYRTQSLENGESLAD
jgi:ABC-type multidrug transport system fused ATPase/permease subunit